MDPNIRTTIQINTFYYFLISIFFAILTQLITMLAIIFGDFAGKENVIAAPLIVITLTTSFGMIRMALNLGLIISDMDEKMAQTNFGRETKKIPVHILGFLFSGLFLISAIVMLSSIYS